MKGDTPLAKKSNFSPRGEWIAYSLILPTLALALLSACVGERESDFTQPDPYEAVITFGFDPEYPFRRNLNWLPLTVHLRSNGPAAQGNLLIRFHEGLENYRIPIDIPERGQATLKPMVFIGHNMDELEFFMEVGRNRHPLGSVTVATLLDESTLATAIISEERGSHAHMGQAPDLELRKVRRVVYTTPSELPRYGLGYQSLNTLIWDGGPEGPLSADQQKALDDWIQMGGTLVLAAGSDWQRLANSSLRLYVPITLADSQVIEAGTQLSGPPGEVRPTLRNQTVIAAGELIDDPAIRARLWAGQTPFLVERPWGAGRIIYSAASLSQPLFEDRLHQELLNQYLTDHNPLIQPQAVNDLDPYVTSFLRWMLQAELPTTTFIALYLGLYILLVAPVNYFVFRWIGRLEWAWFTVPIWAVAFAVGVYYIGALRQQSQVAINQVSVIEARPSANMAQSTTYSAIYSPVRQWYNIRFDAPAAFPQIPMLFDFRRGSEQFADDRLDIRFIGGETGVENFLIYHWSQRLLKAQHLVDLGGGVDLRLRDEHGRLRGEIANNTPYILKHLKLNAMRRSYTLDDLPPGESQEIDLHISEMPLRQDPRMMAWGGGFGFTQQRWSQDFNRFRDDTEAMIAEELQRQYVEQLQLYSADDRQVVLTSAINLAPLPMRVNQERIEQVGDSLLCVSAYLGYGEFDAIEIRDRIWTFARAQRAAQNQWRFSLMPASQGFDFLQIEPDRRIEFGLVSRIPIQSDHIRSLRITFDYQSLNSRSGIPIAQRFGAVGPVMNAVAHPSGPIYDLHIYDFANQRFMPLSQAAQPDGAIERPGRYIDFQNNALVFQLLSPSGQRTILDPRDITAVMRVEPDDEATRLLGRSLLEVEIIEDELFEEIEWDEDVEFGYPGAVDDNNE